MRVLVVNAGSSSLKLSLLDDDRLLLAENVPAARERFDADAVRDVLGRSGEVDAVGHRVVHGGTEFVEPTLVDPEVLRRLEALIDLAPLHQPKSLHALELVTRLLPGAPAFACFDTAFHARLPAAASTYALPAEWRKRWPLRRFGFHGLSHAYASRRAAELAGRDLAELRIVTCHLGAGASLAAVAAGRSVDTTMGFTPLEGLAMATRSGTIDPGIVHWLVERAGEDLGEVADALEHRSGMLALAGTGDMAAVVRGAGAGDAAAGLALAVYLHRLRAAVAAMAAALGGLEVLVFTGGVGEHGGAVRQGAAAGLGFLGVALDEAANATTVPDAEVGAPGAPVRTLVIAAREELQMAAEVRVLLRG